MNELQKEILRSYLDAFKAAQNNHFNHIETEGPYSIFDIRWNQLESLCEFYVGQSFGVTRIITKISDIDIDTLVAKLEALKKLSSEGKLDALIAEEETRLFADDEELPTEPFSQVFTS